MIKRLLILGVIVIPVISVLTAYQPVDIMGNGAPASSTGAPSENSCAVSGCHDTYLSNFGTASLNISIIPDVHEYVPGNKYTVKISIADNNISRFGFQFVALKNSDQSNAGNIEVTDANRTQVIYNYLNLLDRQYATYTYLGSEAVTTGLGEWTFEWIAPQQNTGSVSFYFAGTSADNDGTDNGDHVYTQSLQLNEGTASAASELKNENPLMLFATPNSSVLVADFSLAEKSKVELSIYDLSGKKLETFSDNFLEAGKHRLHFDIGEKFFSGIYIANLKINLYSISKKIAIR